MTFVSLFLVFVQPLVAEHCKGPDPVPSRSPLALPMPTPRLEDPAVCGLQTPHPKGQSAQKPPLWGVQLGEGTGVSWFLPTRSRLLPGWAPGFKTSHVSNEAQDPFPILPDVLLGGTLSLT